MTVTAERREAMRAVADAHDAWAASTEAPFDPAGHDDKSVYNQHYVDLDADGAAQDAYADQVAAAIGDQTAAVIDEHGNHHSERDGRFVRKGGGAARRLSNIAKALESGEPDALAPFNREQLQREVRRLNREGADIKLRRGASEDEIKDAISRHAGPKRQGVPNFSGMPEQEVIAWFNGLSDSQWSGMSTEDRGAARDQARRMFEGGERRPAAAVQKLDLKRTGEVSPEGQAQANIDALMDTARVREAKLKLERGVKMHGSDRSKWPKKDQEAAAKLDKIIAGGAQPRSEDEARARQADIDAVRPTSEVLADTWESLDDGAEGAELERAINQAVRVRGLPLDHPLLVAAKTGDIRKVRAELIKAEKAAGLVRQPFSDRYDPSTMQSTEPRSTLPGSAVKLIKPGYSFDRGNERISLSKSVVEKADNPRLGGMGTVRPAPAAPADRDMEARDRQSQEAMAQVEAISNAIKTAPGGDRTPEEGARERTQAALDGLKKPQLADVARELGVPFTSKATKPQIIRAIVQTKIEGLINTRSIMRTDVSSGFNPGRIAASNIRAIQDSIRGTGPSDRSGETGARERARASLKGFPKPALIEAAGELGVPISSRASAAQIIDSIVDITIGSLLLTRSIERPSQTAAAGDDDGLVLDAAFSAALEAAMELGDDATEEEFAAEFMAEFASRMPEHLQRYWTEGAGAARVRWFVRGAFRRCRRVLRSEGVPGRMLDGTCANLYHRATGRWPGSAKTQTAAVEVDDEFAALTAVEWAELVDILTEEMNMGEDHGTQTACGCGSSVNVAQPPAEMAADDGYVSIWEGPLAPMSTPTGDAEPRMFAPGALSGRGLPRALRWQPQQERGHDGAVVVGALTHYWLDDKGTPWGRAYFFDENVIPEAAKARYLAEHGVVAPSVDLEPSMDVAFTDEDGNQFNPMTCGADGSCPTRPRSMITRGTIASATLVPIAAFGELGSGRLYRGPQPTVDAYRSATQIAAVRFAGWDDMPIADKSRPWDRAAAEQRIADWAAEGNDIDWERYGQAFLWHDSPADTKGAFKFPVADVIEDELVIIPRAVFSAAARLGQADIPAEAQDGLREAISDIYDQMAEELDDDDLIAPWDDDREEMSVQGCGCAAKIGAMVPDGTQTASAGCDSCGAKYGVFGNLEPYPADAFGPVRFDQLTPVHIEQRPGESFARVVGHVGDWKGCHRSFKHVCVPPPKSRTNYAEFHTAGHVRTPDGLLRVGKVVMGEGHPDSSVPARIARAYYDATSKEIAHVRGYEDQFGPYINGVLAPAVTPQEATTFLASPVSGDWKNHEMIAVLAVNVGGHPIRTAATFDANGVPRNVVAAGRFWPDEDDADVQEAAAVLWAAEHRQLLEVIG